MFRLILKSTLLLLGVAALIGCGGGEASRTETNVAANSNQPAVAQTRSPANDNRGAEAKPLSQRIAGAYILGEVHKGGVVTMISPELKTILALTSDGGYTRIASKEGRMYRRDSGTYRVEEPDKIELTIQNSTEKGIHNPPTKRPLSFTLSEDGNELRLKNEDGSIGVFRRSQSLESGRR